MVHVLLGHPPFTTASEPGQVFHHGRRRSKKGKQKPKPKSAKERVKQRHRLPNHLTTPCHTILRDTRSRRTLDQHGTVASQGRAELGFALPQGLASSYPRGSLMKSTRDSLGGRGIDPIHAAATPRLKAPLAADLERLRGELPSLPEGRESKRERQAIRRAIHEIASSEAYIKSSSEKRPKRRKFPEFARQKPGFEFDAAQSWTEIAGDGCLPPGVIARSSGEACPGGGGGSF